jgi:TRAP-type C4-dicarboxylate transport system permease small subunit
MGISNQGGIPLKELGRFIWVFLLKAQRLVMLVGICVATTSVFIEVIMRYVFKSPFVGIEELAAYSAFWVYFIGGAYGAYERSHIKAELTHLLFGSSLNYAKARALTSLVSFCAAGYALPWAYEYFVWGIVRKEQSVSTFLGSTYPVVLFQASILVGLLLMCFYFFVELLQWLNIVFVKKSIPEEMLSSRKEIESWI